MPHPENLRREAEQHRQQADALERQAHDLQREIEAHDTGIRNLERQREEYQRRLHDLELRLAGQASQSESNTINGEIRDINQRLLDLDSQIQTARNAKNALLS